MKKSIKILSILMMAIMIIMVATPVFANSTIIDELESEVSEPQGAGRSKILELVGTILGFLRWVAVIGGVVLITIIGIKYMMGSLEEKAQYQKAMVPLIIGIIVVMGATFIAKLLFDAFAL